MYPFLKEDAQPLPKDEKKGIFRNIKALAAYKLGSTVLNGTDNIIITALFSVGNVGLVSNYVMINSAFTTILGKITDAFTASVGNLNVNTDTEKKYHVFKKIFFLCAWMFGFASVGILLLADEVVTVWVGGKYVLDYSTVVALTLSFYVSSMQYAAYAFRTTSGIFVEGRMAPIAATVLNIVLSILMGRKMGLCGVFFATSISRFFTIVVVDGMLIYRKLFNRSPLRYYGMYFAYLGLFVILFFGIGKIIGLITVCGIPGLILRILTVTLIFNAIMIAIFANTDIFRELMLSLRGIIRRKVKAG